MVDAYFAVLLWRLPMLGIGLPKQGANTLAYGKRMFEKASFIESLSPAEREIAAG